MNTVVKCFIVESFTPETGVIALIWLVTMEQFDKYRTGQEITFKGDTYILGKRDTNDDVISYEMILKEEVLEL